MNLVLKIGGDFILTIGYVGNGKSTNRYHLPFVLRRDNIKVKTIYARDVTNTHWDKISGVYYTSNINELMADPGIDMIVVCTRQDSHYRYAKMALNYGKHVLVEKPFTMTFEEAKDLFTEANKRGLIVECYQNRRYDSDFLTVQKVIESGKLGDIFEIEMNFDYYRPEVPESIQFSHFYDSFLYGHGCHTIDQVISYFGKPDSTHYDVRCLLGPGRFNDYFDLDLFYGNLKISVRASYFRIKARPSFIVYGKKGMFIKEFKDRQEEHLKSFYMPVNDDFGKDKQEHYGVLSYVDENGKFREEEIVTVDGDYGRVYDTLYAVIVEGKEKIVKDDQTLSVMEILETGIKLIK